MCPYTGKVTPAVVKEYYDNLNFWSSPRITILTKSLSFTSQRGLWTLSSKTVIGWSTCSSVSWIGSCTVIPVMRRSNAKSSWTHPDSCPDAASARGRHTCSRIWSSRQWRSLPQHDDTTFSVIVSYHPVEVGGWGPCHHIDDVIRYCGMKFK